MRDPGAHSATAPNPPAAASGTAHVAKASRADARRPPFEGPKNKRIARMRDPGAQSATAPNLSVDASAPVHGAQAKPPEAAPGA
jgi:hypothetical protein